MSEDQHGVVFPVDAEGRRSTAALGRAVAADALRPVDAAGALAAAALIGAHCPRVEVVRAQSVELVVKALADPGAILCHQRVKWRAFMTQHPAGLTR